MEIDKQKRARDESGEELKGEQKSEKKRRIEPPPPPTSIPTEYVVNENVALELQCPICLVIPLIPHELQCGHLGCKECLREETDKRHKCPICRAVMQWSGDVKMSNSAALRVAGLDLKCCCGEKMTAGAEGKKFIVHAMSCGEIQSKCKLCDAVVKHVDWNSHAEVCPKRKINCEYCDEVIAHDEMEGHIKIKEEKDLECSGLITCRNKCGKKVTRRNYIHHLAVECPKQPFQCKACGEFVEVSRFNDHLKDKLFKHVEILLEDKFKIWNVHDCQLCRDVFTTGKCSINLDKKGYGICQCWFECEDCNPDRRRKTIRICAACANICHAGHRIVIGDGSNFNICDCSKDDGNRHKC